jgi:phosphate transport system permease protein
MASSLSENALRAVPQSLREAAYALGSSRLQTSLRVVLPAALSGVTASFLLAFARAVGETMIVSIAAGQQARMTLNPLGPVQTMTAFILQVGQGDAPAGTVAHQTIFAVGMSLFLITFGVTLLSQTLKRKFGEVCE